MSNDPVERKRVVRRFEPLNPNDPEIFASETLTRVNGETIEETQQDNLKYLQNGMQIKKDMVLFRDPVTGEIVEMESTFTCSGCYQRFSLRNLKKEIKEEQKQFCEPCWRKEKWARRKSSFFAFIKKGMEPI